MLSWFLFFSGQGIKAGIPPGVPGRKLSGGPPAALVVRERRMPLAELLSAGSRPLVRAAHFKGRPGP